MTYRAKPITQRDGSSLQNSNCLMAAAAVGLDYHTLGKKTSTGKKMRDFSGDTSGGTNTDEIERAWKNGYDEDPITRDGQPWSKVLEDLGDGRAVMLQVWHATVGKVCLSGSGQYGHGITVAPESRMADGNKEWLVADPWCKPPSWGWVRESKLKAGAEEWYRRCTREAGGGTPTIRLIRAAARLLMSRFFPGGPEDQSADPGAGGPTGILFASTKPHAGSDDVSINLSGKEVSTLSRVDIQGEAGFYADANLTQKYGTITGGSRELLGPASGTNSFAIIVKTSKPYDDGEQRPTVVYVTKDKCGEPYKVEPPPDDIAARDAEWRAWLDGDTGAPDR